MPMTWHSDAEAKLFGAIIQVTDLKISQKNLKEIAEIMGEGCTPKAITHRIAKYKNRSKADLAEAKAGGKTAAASKGTGKGAKATKEADSPAQDGDDEETGRGVTSKKGGCKRKYESDDEDGGGTNVKVEGEWNDGGALGF